MQMKVVPLVVAGTLAGLPISAAESLPLQGDGVHDDTAAIQARLDAGSSCVYLPPPAKEYLISKALKIGSGQELRLDRFTRIRLAPGSDTPMLVNKGVKTGDRHIAVTGGIWDYDNTRQSPNPHQVRFLNPPQEPKLPKSFDPDFHLGVIMRLDNVRDLVVRGLTLRNPTTYALQLTRTSYFLVDDIEFDFTAWNPIPLNMDGVHLDGGCHHGKISNLRGTCFDDLVALNANDGICSNFQGPIRDIDIDGIYAEYCHSAVRILSNGADVRGINIANIHGNFYRYVVGITHYFRDSPPGTFDQISIRDCRVGCARIPDALPLKPGYHRWPLVWCENKCDIGSLRIENFVRDEYFGGYVPTIGVDPRATVRSLAIRDSGHRNHTKDRLAFLCVQGTVDKLTLEKPRFESDPGSGENIERDDTWPLR